MKSFPVRVKVTDDQGFEKTVLLKADLLRVGRDPSNELQLDHPSIAVHHLVIYREADHHLLVNTSQGQVTLLNGSPVVRERLEHGDQISLGPEVPYRLSFLVEGTRRADLQEKWLRSLLRASRAMNSSLVLDEILDRMMDSVMEITSAAGGFVVLTEADATLKPHVARNIEIRHLREEACREAWDLIRQAVASRRSVLSGSTHCTSAAGGPGGGSLESAAVAVPILLHSRIGGVIYVVHKGAMEHPLSDDLEILESVAEQAAVAIENSMLTERMLLAERLSTIGQMVSSILHDFKGPITCIRLSGQQLQLGSLEPSSARLTKRILDAAERMTDMAREVLDFCRGHSALNTCQRRLSSFLSQLMDRVQEEMAARHISLVLEVRADAHVAIDSQRMERALRNLFDNAAEAMPQGGVLTLRTEIVDDTIHLSVTDTGCGMAEEVRQRLFEPFFTYGKPSGTGLGMAIARRIVEEHRWQIQVESTVGVGTSIRMRLPAETSLLEVAPREHTVSQTSAS